MALNIRMALKVPHIPLLNAQESQTILRREVGTAVQGIVEDIATQARARTPVGVSGILRASIGTKVTLGTDAAHLARGEVFSGAQAPYAEFVEYGRRPGKFPPWGEGSSLRLWVQRVIGDGSRTFIIARAIARRGIRGRFMFTQAMATVRPSIEPRLRAALDRAARLISGGR